jgi:large subunit ribosomal protein L24
MKPTKTRNKLIHHPTFHTRSKQLGSHLSEDLQKKYGKKSVRVTEGDNVKILRGEFKGVDGKILKVSSIKSSVAIEGVKKEKTKGDKFDVYIHTSNLLVTGLNSDDKWRITKLEGKKVEKKQSKKNVDKDVPKETKVVKSKKKEVEK